MLDILTLRGKSGTHPNFAVFLVWRYPLLGFDFIIPMNCIQKNYRTGLR
ncbi:Uncharacterised protein [Kluyvera intermedia]|nr:Uncharacterised protein [Kluyvera intermedia]